MNKKAIISLCMAIAICFTLAAVSNAAEENTGSQARNFWQKLFNYPAKVTKDSVTVVAKTTERTAEIVTTEVQTVGQVTSGDVEKTGDLVVEPVKGTVETVEKTVTETVVIPVEAAK